MEKVDKHKTGGFIRRYANRETKLIEPPLSVDGVTLETVYDAFQDMIFTKDTTGRITSVNEVFAKRSLLPKEELIGLTAYDLPGMPLEAAEQISHVDEHVMKTQNPYLSREWITFSDGVSTFVEQVTTPMIADGQSKGVLVIIKDITELKLMMEEVEKQNTILETVSKVSELMLEPDINAFNRSINEAMEIIARGINAERIDIWRLRGKGTETYYALEYEWSADQTIGNIFDIDNKQKVISADISIINILEDMLAKGSIVNSKVDDLPEPAQKIFRDSGIAAARSALIMPINLADEYWGFIGAFDMVNERLFTENEELLLRSSRQMIAGAMTRMQITKDLMNMTEQLKYELTSKSDFFARMSHEIRTPMNAILGMTELALRERMSNVANEHIMTVKQTGMNLLSIINDILDFSKIESGNMDIINADYALSSLIYDIVNIIRTRLAHTRIRFIVDIDSNLPCGLVGDEGKIRQILINLLSNSVKYTQVGFIKLTVIGQMRDDKTLDLELVVTDSGKGIKEEDQKKLFRDYVQVDSEKNVGIEGVGLGLSITHGLVTAMGGKISLTSVYGEGSEFTAVIPQAVEDFEKLASVIDPESKTTLVFERRSLYVETLVKSIENLGIKCDVVDTAEEAIVRMGTGVYTNIIGSTELLLEQRHELEQLDTEFQIIAIAEFGDDTDSTWRTLSTPVHTISLANVFNGEAERYAYIDENESALRFSAPEAKILVVDDIATNLKVAAGLLSIFDADIDVSSSGPEAIGLVKENDYDIIFMDHKMPGMDGIETTAAIRALAESTGGDTARAEYYKNVPIIVLTANVMSNMKDMFLQSGFNDFVAKPIDTVVLSNIMRKWIPKGKQRRYYAIEKHEDKTQLNRDTGISFTIPGVDVEKGFRASGGKPELYLEILSTFQGEASERLAQLYELLEAGNLRMYTINVHAIKGALANIGADELSALAAKLEAAGDRKDKDFIEKNNERFISGTGRLLANIKTVLSESAKSVGEGKQVSKKEAEQFLSTLERLQKALDEMDAGTMNKALEALLSEAITEQSLSQVRLISKHILMAEYEEAEKITAELIDYVRIGTK